MASHGRMGYGGARRAGGDRRTRYGVLDAVGRSIVRRRAAQSTRHHDSRRVAPVSDLSASQDDLELAPVAERGGGEPGGTAVRAKRRRLGRPAPATSLVQSRG